jgi:hypothetical protein
MLNQYNILSFLLDCTLKVGQEFCFEEDSKKDEVLDNGRTLQDLGFKVKSYSSWIYALHFANSFADFGFECAEW